MSPVGWLIGFTVKLVLAVLVTIAVTELWMRWGGWLTREAKRRAREERE